MNKVRIFFIALLALIGYKAFSQEKNTVEMADVMRSSGKIYVVVAVLATVFVGIIVFLISIDKKVSNLEKKVK